MTIAARSALVILSATLLAACTQAPTDLTRISTPGAPKAAGAYSQAVVANGWVYTAGMLPRDPATGAIEGDITAQTNRVFDSLEAILKASGCTLKDVVKMDVYLSDLADFAKMDAVAAGRFGDNKPARTTVGAKLPVPGSLVEIDFIARVPKT